MNFIKSIISLTVMLYTGFVFGQNELQERINRGKQIYNVQCIACHMENGEGLTGAFPPLAKSDYLLSDIPRAAQNILKGLSGEIKVNGVSYYGSMPSHNLSTKELTDVVNYISNSWGNEFGLIEEETIATAIK
ncbi:c-type cytochrome [Formosa haliotis]|uniref:c-type cytochrome n=1 Tax=Formosa haliotis TaxID=1555194 RepID=UPI000824681E|nr:cytochrome c [Formosa haliotis]